MVFSVVVEVTGVWGRGAGGARYSVADTHTCSMPPPTIYQYRLTAKSDATTIHLCFYCYDLSATRNILRYSCYILTAISLLRATLRQSPSIFRYEFALLLRVTLRVSLRPSTCVSSATSYVLRASYFVTPAINSL